MLQQTTLCNTALDNPTQRNKDQMITAALKFLETDTVWYNIHLFKDLNISLNESEFKLAVQFNFAVMCYLFN